MEGKMDPKETCNLETCQNVMGVFERFYSTVPNEDDRAKLIELKFGRFKDTLESQGLVCQEYACLPMLKLLEMQYDSTPPETKR
jgi:hypothetical protein